MIKTVSSIKEIREFVDFIKTLYRDDPLFVFPIFKSQYKDLEKAILQKKTYKGLLCYDEAGTLRGRILFTYHYDKSRDEKICFFSFFDLYDDVRVAEELFAEVYRDMRENGISYIEGTYTPFDPDARRGILCEGYEYSPTSFNSYNFPYYNTILEALGFTVHRRTISVLLDFPNDTVYHVLTPEQQTYLDENISFRHVSFKNMDSEIDCICKIMEKATHEINYQKAPDKNMIKKIFKKARLLYDEKFVFLAFDRHTGEPIGFTSAYPDFNQVLKRTKGKIRILTILLQKKKIDTLIGNLQYIIPEYQGKGIIIGFYQKVQEECIRQNIRHLEGGTMMEDNQRAYSKFLKIGAKIHKRYALYGKSI